MKPLHQNWPEKSGLARWALVLFLSSLLVVFGPMGWGAEKQKGKTLVVALDSNPTILDPRLALDAVSERINQLLYSRLVQFDQNLNIVPDLAVRWENPDPVTYEFYLKKEALFHNGKPVTSQDVKYTFESIIDPALGSAKRGSLSALRSIETPDPWTVIFRLKEPFAPFMVFMVQGIVPMDIARSEGSGLGLNPVGSGPFKFSGRKQEDRIELEANGRYYGAKPKLEKVVFRFIPDETTRLLELEKGTVHLIQNGLSPDMLLRIKEKGNLKILTGPSTNYSYIGFNLEDPVTKNKLLRQAIASAINRENIINNILKGMATPAISLLPPEHWAYEKDLALYPYDPALAAQLLEQAGFKETHGEGPKARLKLVYKTSQNQLSRRIAEVMQQDLKKIGVDLGIQSYEWGTFFSHIRSGNFQVYSLTWVGVMDPDIFYYIFHSSSIPPAGANRGRYSNPELDSLLERGRSTLDLNERKAIYSRVQKIIASDVPYISLWHEANIAVMHQDLEGFQLYPNGEFTSLKAVYFKK